MATYLEQVRNILLTRSGLTHRELAQAVFGPDNPHDQKVARQLAQLETRGLVRKEGQGGNKDQYRYFLTEAGKSVPHE
jgi:DNA-binding HxlR family transcriptional regulator